MGKGGKKGPRRCYNCNLFGHLARDCPNKGGKGGAGAAPHNGKGCFECGGPHFASQCPNKGKGKGQNKSHSKGHCRSKSKHKGKGKGRGTIAAHVPIASCHILFGGFLCVISVINVTERLPAHP